MWVVDLDDEGNCYLNNMWLPTWIGCSPILLSKIEKELQDKIVGREISSSTLEELHNELIFYIQDHIAPDMPGIKKYLAALRYVQI